MTAIKALSLSLLKIMEMLQATKDKMVLSSRRSTTLIAVLSIALPITLIVTLMYQNSIFNIFEGFSEDNEGLGGRAQNVTTQLLSGKPNVTTRALDLGASPQNITNENLEGREKNITESGWTKPTLHLLNGLGKTQVLHGRTQNATAIEKRAQNISVPDIGLKNASSARISNDLITNSSTNDSTPPTENPADKLLDGLLASGIAEKSCLSRYQSYLYRKASPHKPSPYLISKLRNYEEIHTRCGPHTSAYNRTMIKLVRSKNHGTSTMCNYLVWTPANGLGNRIISISAAFLYAVLTGRVLLVKFDREMTGLFCEPFPNSTWTLPEKSPFWSEKHVETYQTVLKNTDNNSKEIIPSALLINLQHTKGDPEKFFHCDSGQDILQKVPFLILRTDQYFVPSLFMIPSFNQELSKMFPEKDTVFHHLGRFLFLPSNEAWGLISRFYQAYLAKADERIGLQIRVFSDLTPHEAVMDLLLRCTLKNKILPGLDMRNSVGSKWENQTLKAVLVASLYHDFGEKLRTTYLTRPTVTGELIEVYQPSHEEHQNSYDNMHNMKAWMEMYLLSLSDVLVTTSLSTFGYVAQGLGGLKPWLVYRLMGNGTHDPPCERDFSMEPCYHVPPIHDCKGKAMKNFGAGFPYMRNCVDYSFGVKLLNGSQ